MARCEWRPGTRHSNGPPRVCAPPWSGTAATGVGIYVGATGMKMMELAGEIAGGAVLNYMVGPKY